MLVLNKVSKIFSPGTVNEHYALYGLSLTLADGEFITVIGENGAGKSTLLNIVSGVFPCDAGKITLDGADITALKEFKRSRLIGRVFQDPLKGTAFDMTIAENLSIAYGKNKPHGLGAGLSKKDDKFFRDKLELLGLGLENRMNHKVGLLSGGQRQALTLLMATIVKPKLLLLDEHTAALDPGAADTITRLTEQIVAEQGIATLMVTHNMKQALKSGSRTIMMSEGQIVLDVSGEERASLTVEDLVARFAAKKGKALIDDRLLLG
ncbi:MAG: ATP-binding cassette domain-containing protein [Oscillospiraceae bacterium]|nr:ATP-binding cassette domain-containing protein [Oscillospiraceae bacterium]